MFNGRWNAITDQEQGQLKDNLLNQGSVLITAVKLTGDVAIEVIQQRPLNQGSYF